MSAGIGMGNIKLLGVIFKLWEYVLAFRVKNKYSHDFESNRFEEAFV
jgi:hypothetical protein